MTSSKGRIIVRQLQEQGLLRVNIIFNGKRTGLEIDPMKTLIDY